VSAGPQSENNQKPQNVGMKKNTENIGLFCGFVARMSFPPVTCIS